MRDTSRRRKRTSGFMTHIAHGIDMRGPSYNPFKGGHARILYFHSNRNEFMSLLQTYLRANYPEKFQAYRQRGIRRPIGGDGLSHTKRTRQIPGVTQQQMAKAVAWVKTQIREED